MIPVEWEGLMGLDLFMKNSRRSLFFLAGFPLCVLLTGCPADSAKTGAPGSVPGYATAPTRGALDKSGAPASQTDPATQAQAANQHAQKVQDVIARAEASYKSGVTNYNSNRLDAARQDFDYAVDTMLSSGLDLKTEPELSDEFERLLGAINSLEMLALKQGNGFNQRLDEAPLESVADMTFPPNPELVARLKSELNTTSDLPLVINDQVAGYINVFSQSNSFRAHMAASMQRLGKYRTLIQGIMKEEGVPQDLIYLAVAESGFQAQVVNSRSGAGGMWQFMTYTGPEYNLTRNAYYDYRFDPEKSSRAYARYIKKLYGLFGDWYLAMAAYDWGPGNIQRVVSRTGYADFWELYRHGSMPAETRAYVPQILAAVIMAKNPEKYGLNKLPPSPPVIYDTVTTNYALDIRLAADLADTSVQDIVGLNPALLRLSTPPDTAFDLHIPPGTKELFLERLKDIPEDKRTSWRFHVVKPGESIDSIATAFKASPSQIATINEVTAARPIEVEDELIIPLATSSATPGVQKYTTRRSDTLVSIADRFGVTVDQLRAWNHLSGGVAAGRSIFVAEPIRLAPGTRVAARARRAKSGGSSRSRGSRASSQGRISSHSRSAHAPSKAPAARWSSHAATSSHTTSTKKKHTH
jgi:membrane-bound lytic murein transglycosylase D